VNVEAAAFNLEGDVFNVEAAGFNVEAPVFNVEAPSLNVEADFSMSRQILVVHQACSVLKRGQWAVREACAAHP